MPLFRYEALTEQGKKSRGTIDADTLQDAKQKLVRLKVAAIRISSVTEKEMRIRLSKREVLTLTREIARLLHAGLPLFEALSALEEKYRGQKFHSLLLDLCDRIRSGQAFSQALAKYPRSFDLLYTAMIANAEKTGRLEASLDELAQLLNRQLHIRKQITAALLYPALLTVFCLIVLSSLLFFVIPSLRELFDGRDLHPFTRLVFACSEFACNAKGFLLFSLLASFVFGSLAWFLSSWKKKILSHLMRLPILKNLFTKIALVRFCRASASLLEGGLPLIAALSQARSVMHHPLLEPFIVGVEKEVAQGEPLSSSFAKNPLIPPLIPRMLAIAEQSGKLSFAMEQIAQIYEDELETTLTHFATLAQPALLLLLGAIIGFVLLSVLLPLTDVSSFAQ